MIELTVPRLIYIRLRKMPVCISDVGGAHLSVVNLGWIYVHNGSVTPGGNDVGVRPSPGAAVSERERAPIRGDASEHPLLAAPGDGRTPPRRSPSVTDRLHSW